MRKMKLRVKLLLSYLCIALMTIGLSLVTRFALNDYINANETNMKTYQISSHMDELLTCVINLETGQRGYALTGSNDFLLPYTENLELFETLIQESKEIMSDMPEVIQNLDEIVTLKGKWQETAEESIRLRRMAVAGIGSINAVIRYEKEEQGKVFMDQMRELIRGNVEIGNNQMQKSIQHQKTVESVVKTVLLIGSIIVVACAIGISFLLSTMICGGLTKVAKSANEMANGNLDFELHSNSNDEIGMLIKSFVTMKDTIKTMTGEISLLADSAIHGDLSKRGDASLFQGAYADIVIGVNKTLDEVTSPIKETVHVLEMVGEGNLNVSVEGEYEGDHATIKNAVNETIASLNEVIGKIADASTSVEKHAKQLAVSSKTISAGSMDQASVVEEISASVEEIAEQTKTNAENAENAEMLSGETMNKAKHGQEQMNQMVQAMKAIDQSSQNISKIIGVIQNIAAQTNMLALNASIEAARAGEAGRGFSVVANQVGELASRSASATQESIHLIEESLRNVEIGMKYAELTADSLNEIVAESSNAAGLVQTISEFCKNQAVRLDEMNVAIEQVASVVQTNASVSQEAAAASSILNDQADILAEQVNHYQLKI